jgi:hypothetical protein
MRPLATYPAAEVVGLKTDGRSVTAVSVRWCFCGGVHEHTWFGDSDELREASCTPYGAVYRITIGTRERIEAMRADFPAPDGVVGLVPLHMSFAFEMDGPDADVVGIVLGTTLGKFAVWLPLESAVGLAGQLVDIAEHREQLRTEYLERAEIAPQDRRGGRRPYLL